MEQRIRDKNLAKQRCLERQTKKRASAKALRQNKSRLLENRKLAVKFGLTR